MASATPRVQNESCSTVTGSFALGRTAARRRETWKESERTSPATARYPRDGCPNGRRLPQKRADVSAASPWTGSSHHKMEEASDEPARYDLNVTRCSFEVRRCDSASATSAVTVYAPGGRSNEVLMR